MARPVKTVLIILMAAAIATLGLLRGGGQHLHGQLSDVVPHTGGYLTKAGRKGEPRVQAYALRTSAPG